VAANKFSISLPADLAAELEALAEQDGVSRSAVIQEASARYVADRNSSKEDQLRRVSVDAALAGFDEIATAWGADPRKGIDYLAELRSDARPIDASEVPEDE
jgi:predicted transcriptional regulator